jgi:glycosyl transferase family 4/glycosyl transferase family 1
MKQKKKLLIIANITNVHTHKFVDEFKRRDWDIRVLSIQPPNIENIKKYKELIIFLPTYKIYQLLIKLPFLKYSQYHNINTGVKLYEPYSIASLFTYLYLLVRIKKIVKKYQPDAIFTIYLTMNGFLAALTKNKNIISSAAGVDVSIHKVFSLKYWLNHAIFFKFAVNKAKRVIAFDAKTFAPIFKLKKCNTNHVLWLDHWGVDTDKFMPRSKDTIINNSVCRFICSRPYRNEFDLESILLSLKKLHEKNKNIEFVIATGSRSDRNRLELEKVLSKTNCLDAEFITILDHIDYSDLPLVINKCDVYMDPINVEKCPESATWGVSGSLLEAMSCGLIPVIRQRPSIDWILPAEIQHLHYSSDIESQYMAIEEAYKLRTNFKLRMKIRSAIIEKANWNKNISFIEDEFDVCYPD